MINVYYQYRYCKINNCFFKDKWISCFLMILFYQLYIILLHTINQYEQFKKNLQGNSTAFFGKSFLYLTE